MDKRRHLATDTGLYAYDVFEVLLNYETARVKRYPSPITLLHVTLASKDGQERRLQPHEAMTDLLNRTLRAADVPSHYQDQFLILLPSTNETGGRAVAERVLASYRTLQRAETGQPNARRDAYVGLTSQEGGSLVTAQQLLAEAAVAMNEARLRGSYTYIAYSDIANELSDKI